MPRTRIRSDQEQDISFVSEEELNEFFGKVVITGTVDTTAVLEDFDTFFPGRGLILSEGQVIVATGTNFITISGGDASGDDIDNLQVQIDAIVIEQAGVGSLTASGVTLSGAITLEGESGVVLHPDEGSNTIVISGSGVTRIITVSGIEGDITIEGAGTVEIITEENTIVVSGTPHTENTDTVSDAIIGTGTVVVTSGVNTTTISGTQHTRGAALSGEWRFQTSTAIAPPSGRFRMNNVTYAGTTELYFSDTTDNGADVTNILTLIDELERIYFQRETDGSQFGIFDVTGPTTDEGDWFRIPVTLVTNGDIISNNQRSIVTILIEGAPIIENAIVGAGTVVVISGSDTTVVSGTPHTINTDTVSNALIAGDGIIITSGTSTTVIDSFDDDDVDSLTVSGTTVTGSVQLETIGSITISADAGTDTVTISGAETSPPPQGSFEGQVVQVEFSAGSASLWMSLGSEDLNSDETPYVFPFPATIIASTFSNKVNDASVDFEINKALAASGVDNAIEGTWSVTTSRVARKSDYVIVGPDISFVEGDKMAIFAADVGLVEAQEMSLVLYFQISENIQEEGDESFTGNFT